MTTEPINVGTSANSDDSDSLREGAIKINNNFTKIHDVVIVNDDGNPIPTLTTGDVGDNKIIVNNRDYEISVSGIVVPALTLATLINTSGSSTGWAMLNSVGIV